jgi:hypothetical protein
MSVSRILQRLAPPIRSHGLPKISSSRRYFSLAFTYPLKYLHPHDSFSHGAIHDNFRKLGLMKETKGVCAGVAQMWIQAFLNAEEKSFFAALEVLGQENLQVEDLKTLLGLQMYQSPEFMNRKITQLHIDAISQQVASMKGWEPTRCVHAHAVIYNREELEKYFQALQNILHDLKDKGNFAMHFSSRDHRIAARYDIRFKQWVLVDAESLMVRIISPRDIAKIIMRALHTTGEFCGMQIGVHTRQDNVFLSGVREIFQVFKKQFPMTFAMTERVDQVGMCYVHFAAKYSDESLFLQLASLNASWNKRDNNGLTPLHNAAYFANATMALAIAEISEDSDTAVRAEDATGFTPAMDAAFCGDGMTLRVLGSLNADFEKKSKAGNHPLGVACHYKNWDAAVQILLIMKKMTDENFSLAALHRKQIAKAFTNYVGSLEQGEKAEWVNSVVQKENALGMFFQLKKPPREVRKMLDNHCGGRLLK